MCVCICITDVLMYMYIYVYMHISADLFQNSSVLDYNCIIQPEPGGVPDVARLWRRAHTVSEPTLSPNRHPKFSSPSRSSSVQRSLSNCD